TNFGRNQVQLFRTITRSLGILAVLSAAVLLGNAGPAAASNGANPLLCFDGTTDTANGDTGGAVYGGVCTRTANGAILDNSVPVWLTRSTIRRARSSTRAARSAATPTGLRSLRRTRRGTSARPHS